MLKLPRACYYAWLAARPAAAARQRAEDELAEEIQEIHATSRGAYGAPRVHAALRRKGHAINRKKVERIMRERDIRGITLISPDHIDSRIQTATSNLFDRMLTRTVRA